MMKIAILGATSQIARDLIVSFSAEADKKLHLFARRPDEVAKWLASAGLSGCYPVDDFAEFVGHEFDAVINFVGVGNPAQALAMGSSIFDITLRFDEMVLDYLKTHPACRYLFLSSGAAYGSSFNEPATRDTAATVAINNLAPHEWYGVAKLHAECRHRAHPELNIIDIRVFNYFSRTQDIDARFLITDILRAIRDKTVLKTSSDYIVRDFLHPSDFYSLVCVLLAAPPANAAVDCYSRAPIDKPALLAAMQKEFVLQYEITGNDAGVNATGGKSHYYSLNTRAADFGYQPSLTSLECILIEAKKIITPLVVG
ncbi:NAD-dependent epimerase/dehydratase family protein [Gallionella capsiferriformans]|uniref:NAD-dependent epimerase/dehydratase n=1 Tax=Gallionella capsiferriformans (strain ES-2) TaxID=395494 RepID=D9SE16_GALCS|nr:NAD-dependent epimerase/dehydratase family protein [Gallionella capsiferriformans]ADL56838.1 NAD-dependent epimerase/dehydratase [Gallionella capsiferriformans ES-2]